MVRPKQFKRGIQSSIYIELEHKEFLEKQNLSLSAFLRDLIEVSMDKIDLYAELQNLRNELTQAKNDNLELLREIDNITKENNEAEASEIEANKLKLTPSDEHILLNPKTFLRYLELYENFTISRESFINKTKMSPERAFKLKEDYIK